MRRKILAALAAAAIALGAFVVYKFVKWDGVDVVDRYSGELGVEGATPAEITEQLALDARMLSEVLAEIDKIEAEMKRMNDEYLVSENTNVGVYTVEQERDIALAYGTYITLRKALFHIMFRHMSYGTIDDEAQQDQSFLLAYASGLALYRNAVAFVVLFKDQPNARRKLNEANPALGVPPRMFDEMYANITSKKNVRMLLDSMAEFAERRPRLDDAPILQTHGLGELLHRMDGYEAQLADAYVRLSEGRSDVVWTTVRSNIQGPAYKTQSFISMMVSEVRVPLHSAGVTPETVREKLVPQLRPGDILLTRRDGYLSNTFLPGFWGHAAMYLGSADEIRALGEDAALQPLLAKYEHGKDRDGFPFRAIEAIGEGVRYSSAEFALHANSVAVLRPKLSDAQLLASIRRAMELHGLPYDFSFDLASQDKLICTELVYRAYAPELDIPLEVMMGRTTLKPDGMVAELVSEADDAPTEFVLYARSVDGDIVQEPLTKLLATVRP